MDCRNSTHLRGVNMRVVPASRGTSSDRKTSSWKTNLELLSLENRTVPAGLGVASSYSAFVFDDFTVTEGGTAQGRVAAGGDVFVQSYSIGSSTWDTPGLSDVLTAGGSVLYRNGQILNGNVTAGSTPSINNVYINPSNIQVADNSAFFASAKADLTNKSAVWAGYAANGTAQNQWGGLFLNGTDSSLNVFTLNSSQLSGIWGININVPWGSQVLVNVTGQNVDFRYAGLFSSTDASKVLYNFKDAQNIQFEGLGFQGNLLAPDAQVTFRNGSFQGTLVAESFGGNATLIRNAPNLTIDAPVASGSIRGAVIPDAGSDPLNVSILSANDVEGLTVKLLGTDINNKPVDLSTTTGPNGVYSFDALEPGTYEVSLDVDPTVYAVDSSAGSLGGIPIFGGIIDIILPVAGISFDNNLYLSLIDLIDPIEPIDQLP
jgi:choice-of-anchor A domain-containing protein